jgi:NADPH:quinone reductase-like Zn-dependent oxidoreductase
VAVAGERGRLLGGLSRKLRVKVLNPFVGERLVTFIAKVDKDDLVVLKELVQSGKVAPVIDRTYPLSEAAEAIRYVETRRARGKVLITV